MSDLNRLSVEAFRQSQKFGFCLVLDNIRSLNNVGSVFRTADAFRAEHLYLCGITGQPPHRDITKTALGATESVAWTYSPDILPLLTTLKAAGWIIVAIEQATHSVSLADFAPLPGGRYAFVLGNEVAGVQDSVVQAADWVLEIPQFGTKHSLNVAVTAGIIGWDFIQKVLKT